MVAHVTVHVVSHYKKDREPILETVLDGLLGWQNAVLDVTVTSNVPAYRDSGFIERKAAEFAEIGGVLRLEVKDDLKNPRLLTWAHKAHLPGWAETASPGEDFFMYIEDDIRVSDENFRYFQKHAKILAPHGLIPGFIRYETREGEADLLVDIVHPEYWEHDRSRKIGKRLYHANINPYWAGFLLDRDMAREYLASPSFDLEKSEGVHHWNVQERAAMGLTYESPPKDLRTRLVVPMEDGRPEPGAFVWHCSNTYSQTDHNKSADLTVDDAYRREGRLHYLRRKARRLLKKARS